MKSMQNDSEARNTRCVQYSLTVSKKDLSPL